jgi:quercetin dioxygenase-like cupin family protein
MQRTTLLVLLMAGVAIFAVAARSVDLHTSAGAGFTKQMVIDKPKVQVVRVTAAPGAIEPPGPHAYDVVLVPLNEALMGVTIEGKPVKWRFGEPIYIQRGVEHEVSNKGHEAVEFLSIRIL